MSPERIRPGSARGRGATPGPPGGGAPGAPGGATPGTPGGGAPGSGAARTSSRDVVAGPESDETPGGQPEDDLGETPIALPLSGVRELDPSLGSGDPVQIVGPQRGGAPLRPEEFVDLEAAEEVLGHDRVEAYRRGVDPLAPGEEPDEVDEVLYEQDLAAAVATPGASARHERAFTRLYHGRTRFDFVRRRRVWFSISLLVILAGAVSLGVRGLNLGIDFAGGTSWQVATASATVSGNQLVNNTRSALGPLGLSGAVITILGSNKSTQTIEVEAKLAKGASSGQTLDEIHDVSAALAKVVHSSAADVSVDQVGPSWGSSVTNKAILALVVFFILISIYISIFFEWRMALAAVAAVAHDVLVVVGIYSLTGLQVTPDTVVAILTILGYSLYDTIVVFDRVRDNIKSRTIGGSNRITISDIINLSMNQTLARSVNTSLVAILPIFAVLVLGADVLGATTLQYFGWALLIGLLSGAYSSIFIASPLVAMLKEREQRYRIIRERLVLRGGDRLLLSPEAVAAGVFGPDGALATSRRQRRAEAAGAGAGAGATRSAGRTGGAGSRGGGSRGGGPGGASRPSGRITPGSGSRPSASGGAGASISPEKGSGPLLPGSVPESRVPAGSAGRGNGRPAPAPGAGNAGRPPARRARKGRQR